MIPPACPVSPCTAFDDLLGVERVGPLVDTDDGVSWHALEEARFPPPCHLFFPLSPSPLSPVAAALKRTNRNQLEA